MVPNWASSPAISSVEIARLLLEHGVKIRNTGAVHNVAGRWWIDIPEVSLEYGAELDERVGCDSETPLHGVVGMGSMWFYGGC
jgi:hypothetical protein